MSIVQGTLPVGSLDHAITLNVQSSGGSHFETVTDTTPYLHRASPQDVASSMKLKKVVGGTIAWNQIITANYELTQEHQGVRFTRNADGSITVSGTVTGYTSAYCKISDNTDIKTGHKYYYSSDSKSGLVHIWYNGSGGFIGTSVGIGQITALANGFYIRIDWEGTEVNETVNPIVIDLTQMFGSTIADYIYSLEQAHAGDGVAWFRKLFPKAYYPYNAGELMSVKTSARKTYDADNVEIGSYALDSDLELRGIPKLDSNNELYYDGDTYASDGTVTRRYGVIDLGSSTLGWQRGASGDHYVFDSLVINKATGTNFVCPKYVNARTYRGALLDKQMGVFNLTSGTYRISIRDDSYSDASSFTTAMDGVYLVYELATPTTESADAYTQSQRVGATEEFVDGRTVEIPVGNVSEYKRLIQED